MFFWEKAAQLVSLLDIITEAVGFTLFSDTKPAGGSYRIVCIQILKFISIKSILFYSSYHRAVSCCIVYGAADAVFLRYSEVAV